MPVQDLKGCPVVTDADVAALWSVPRPRLRFVAISNCPQLSVEALLQLVHHVPDAMPALEGA